MIIKQVVSFDIGNVALCYLAVRGIMFALEFIRGGVEWYTRDVDVRDLK